MINYANRIRELSVAQAVVKAGAVNQFVYIYRYKHRYSCIHAYTNKYN